MVFLDFQGVTEIIFRLRCSRTPRTLLFCLYFLVSHHKPYSPQRLSADHFVLGINSHSIPLFIHVPHRVPLDIVLLNYLVELRGLSGLLCRLSTLIELILPV